MPKQPPKLLDGYKRNFETLLAATNNGDLALVSAIRRADEQPVALVAAIQHEEDGSCSIVPLAVMIEGNPYELFDPPHTDGGPS